MITSQIYIGSDHAGLTLKAKLCDYFQRTGVRVLDIGTYLDEPIDYPDVAQALSQEVAAHETSMGILVCGTGIGMSISANRNKSIRAALCHNVTYARLARLHNDANVLVLGARYISVEEATQIAEAFLSTEFEGGRHITRVKKLTY